MKRILKYREDESLEICEIESVTSVEERGHEVDAQKPDFTGR